MVTSSQPALLVLEDGTIVRGRAWGARGKTLGELVFATGMTGYQETLTDPSYHRQIVMMTAPHIGNTGFNDEDYESSRIWVAGIVARDPARIPSNWRAQRSLDDVLEDDGIVGICDVDTRALTRRLRSVGTMKAGIFSGDASAPESDLLEEVRAFEPKLDLASEVTVEAAYELPPAPGTDEIGTVVAIDLGIKSTTPVRLSERGLRVHVLPATATFEDIAAYDPDGVFFSNGPGDPAAADRSVAVLRQVLDAKIPYFGICFGNQLLGRALGFGTYKLNFGHRGINQPVKNLQTGKLDITSQNHGYAVDAQPGKVLDSPYGRVEVSHVSLNDQVVEGLQCLDIPAFSVQFHPEAAAGPHDASYLFDSFVNMIQKENA